MEYIHITIQNSDSIRNLDVFNDRGLDYLINNWQKATTKGVSNIDESIAWLCSLHDMLKVYNISQPKLNRQKCFKDVVRGSLGDVHTKALTLTRNNLRD